MIFKTRLLSSLSKVFADAACRDKAVASGSALLGEYYSFQVAYYGDKLARGVKISIESELESLIRLRQVSLIPSDYPSTSFDDKVLRKTPGLYPDLLEDLPSPEIDILPFQWRALWISLKIPEELPEGRYPVKIRFRHDQENIDVTEEFVITVIAAKLPEQELIHTEWFHTDCIASYYNTRVWSRRHWELLRKYVSSASAHGINMILTPLFTPPLDTVVGGERPTVQLVNIKKNGNKYAFDFSLLERWIKMLDKCGIKYVEFSHLFTQWGAGHAPKIIARENGVDKQIFGWETDAGGKKYRDFLKKFLPELMKLISRLGLRDKVYFHISDEPHDKHIDSYRSAVETVKPLLEGGKIIDALSDVRYFRRGFVDSPIPIITKLEEFIEAGMKEPWTYYCCLPARIAPNRFFCMPSTRNRIIGMLAFKYNLRGFLHWGFNFWFSQFSLCKIDPFRTSDAGKAFPSGDSYLVYPGSDGPLDSIRYEVLREGLQDLRALRLLEKISGRKHAIGTMEKNFGNALSVSEYPLGIDEFLPARERINEKLKQLAHL